MYLEIKCLSYLLISSLSLNKFNLYIYVARITFIPFILIPFLFSLGKKKGQLRKGDFHRSISDGESWGSSFTRGGRRRIFESAYKHE